jgi:hypothetical protein
MNQPGLGYTSNSQISPASQADASTSHKIDILCLAILVLTILTQFVGFFSCLIRSDYNFAVIFFCYFVWQQRKDSLALKIVLDVIIVDFGINYYIDTS